MQALSPLHPLKAWLRSALVATPPPGDGAGRRGFLHRLLRGDYPLVRAFWLHYQLGYFVYQEVRDALIYEVSEHAPGRYEFIALLAMRAPDYLVWIVLVIGAWMSARRHVARGGARGWAIVAQLAIAVLVLAQLSVIPNAVNDVRASWQSAVGTQPGPAPVFLLSEDGRSLTLDGVLQEGTAVALETVLARHPQVTTLVLNAERGWLHESRRVGHVIATRGLHTHVQQRCVWVCAISFLSGRVRSAADGAQLGFGGYGPAAGEDPPVRERKIAGWVRLRETYDQLGMHSDFVYRVATIPFQRMWYPDDAELAAFHVLTQPRGQSMPDLRGPTRQVQP
jgi:hypothetical protein